MTNIDNFISSFRELLNGMEADREAGDQSLASQLSILSSAIEAMEERLSDLEEPVDPGEPVDPDPITPELGEVNILTQGGIIPGSKKKFEVVIDSSFKVKQVDFYLNTEKQSGFDKSFDVFLNTERYFKYESTFFVPNKDFQVKVVITFEGTDSTLEGVNVFEVEASSPIDPDPVDPGLDWVGLDQYDTIIFQNDGAKEDPDDIASIIPQTLYSKMAGITDKFHIFFGVNVNESDNALQLSKLRDSANFASENGISTYDLSSADGFADEIESHTRLISSGKVLVLAGGPMAVMYQSLSDLDPEQYKNITVVSHAAWNNDRNKVDPDVNDSIPAKTWDDLKKDFPEVRYVDIPDQNGYGNANAGFNNVGWRDMDKSSSEIVRQGYNLMKGANLNGQFQDKDRDASDFGMLYSVDTGKLDGKPSDVLPMIEQFFKDTNPVDPTIPSFQNLAGGIMRVNMDDIAVQNPSVWAIEKQGQQNELSDDFVTFTGDNSYEQWKSSSKLSASIKSSGTGTYQVLAFSRSGSKVNTSDENDTWVRINTAEFYGKKSSAVKTYAKGNKYGKTPVTKKNDSSEGAFKLYTDSQGSWGLNSFVVDDKKEDLLVDLIEGNTYVFEISGRSKGHSIHSFYLKPVDKPDSLLDPHLPQVLTPPDPIDPTPPDVSGDISEFDDFIDNSDGIYYNLQPDNLPVKSMSDKEVAQLFNTGATHMGKPNGRARIEEVAGKKAFSVVWNGQSGGYGNRFSSQKTNAGNSTLYPDAKAVASYSELYFDSEKMKDRTHFKCSSFTSKQGPPPSGSNSTTSSPRLSHPGKAEFVRWEFYSKKSQGSPENKGDLMKLYFGQNTYWSAEDYARMDQPDNLVMGAGAYTAHPGLPYKWQNMLYPCKPDANGMPTRERLLIPTDKLIKSWMIWEGNTLNADNSGNYDGTAKWWLQIDGIHGGKPFLAAVMADHLWVTGAPLVIGQSSVGMYFNPGDQGNRDNQFFILRDVVYYKK